QQQQPQQMQMGMGMYAQQQMQQPQAGMFGGGAYPAQNPAALQQAASPGYNAVADLDPYSLLAQLPQAQPMRPPQAGGSLGGPPQSPGSAGGSWNNEHPRSYVQAHRKELDRRDPTAWKGLVQSVDKLQEAWVGRKNLVEQAVAGYGTQWNPADFKRVTELRKEANHNIDQVLAARFQIEEALPYSQSSDNTSRTRVRESLNAGLSALPEWP
ncbi:hypothetical protein DL93DRAFT_2037150, partial [Clavulina sp. PMI_390]